MLKKIEAVKKKRVQERKQGSLLRKTMWQKLELKK